MTLSPILVLEANLKAEKKKKTFETRHDNCHDIIKKASKEPMFQVGNSKKSQWKVKKIFWT